MLLSDIELLMLQSEPNNLCNCIFNHVPLHTTHIQPKVLVIVQYRLQMSVSLRTIVPFIKNVACRRTVFINRSLTNIPTRIAAIPYSRTPSEPPVTTRHITTMASTASTTPQNAPFTQSVVRAMRSLYTTPITFSPLFLQVFC